MEKLAINTPQVVQIEYELASVGKRFLALALDYFFMLVYVLLFSYLISRLPYFGYYERITIFIYVIVFLPVMLYHFLFESILGGQTPGKYLAQIKVVRLDGGRASIYEYFTRWAFNIVDIWMLSAVIGLVAIILSEKSQRLGDMAAGTAVISLKSRLKLNETIYENLALSYEPVYPEHLLTRLSDKDMNIIKQSFQKAYTSNDNVVMERLADKISEVTGIEQGEYRNGEFVNLILKDHYHFHS